MSRALSPGPDFAFVPGGAKAKGQAPNVGGSADEVFEDRTERIG